MRTAIADGTVQPKHENNDIFPLQRHIVSLLTVSSRYYQGLAVICTFQAAMSVGFSHG